MRTYVDSSALIKRVAIEPESNAFVEAFDGYYANRYTVVSSSLAWIEVARALHARALSAFSVATVHADAALSGVAEHPISPEVVSLARRIRPPVLRSLDAIHLASALLIDADQVVTYDVRLAAACTENGLAVTSPGRP
nr:type II toxin-antitoxin system VapC family toxin [Micromonospora sp. DSM 115978]